MDKTVVNNILIFLVEHFKSQNLTYVHSFGKLLKEHNKINLYFYLPIKLIDKIITKLKL